jgi:hypothetical protein
MRTAVARVYGFEGPKKKNQGNERIRRTAGSGLLSRLIGTPDWDSLRALVRDWFSEPAAKAEVSQLLAEYHLDRSAIEAEAIRSLASELEMLDRMLTSLESRRNRALRCLADYQDRFAKQGREVSDRVIEGKTVVQLENRSAKRRA